MPASVSFSLKANTSASLPSISEPVSQPKDDLAKKIIALINKEKSKLEVAEQELNKARANSGFYSSDAINQVKVFKSKAEKSFQKLEAFLISSKKQFRLESNNSEKSEQMEKVLALGDLARVYFESVANVRSPSSSDNCICALVKLTGGLGAVLAYAPYAITKYAYSDQVSARVLNELYSKGTGLLVTSAALFTLGKIFPYLEMLNERPIQKAKLAFESALKAN